MNPRERAEKIPLWAEMDHPGRKEETYSLIEKAIREAVSEAYEECAKIAEDGRDLAITDCCGDIAGHTETAIRSRRKEVLG